MVSHPITHCQVRFIAPGVLIYETKPKIEVVCAKLIRVKAVDGLERISLDDVRSRRVRESLSEELQELAQGQTNADLLKSSWLLDGDVVAVLVEQIEVARVRRIAATFEEGDCSGEVVWVPEVICIEEGDERTRCDPESGIPGLAGSAERAS